MIKAVIAGLVCFTLFLSIHVLVFRTVNLKRRFRALTIIFFSLIPLYMVLYSALPADYVVVETFGGRNPVIYFRAAYRATVALNFLGGLFLYIFLFLGYCQFYFIIDRSISVRIMIEMERSPEKRLDREGIKRAYPLEEILSRRLKHMKEGGYIEEKDGYYASTLKGRMEARLFSFLKGFLRLGPGG